MIELGSRRNADLGQTEPALEAALTWPSLGCLVTDLKQTPHPDAAKPLAARCCNPVSDKSVVMFRGLQSPAASR